ncbi:NACHT, LRR and PYD domains-containing protein 4C [Glossina fuscipes fuscipes]
MQWRRLSSVKLVGFRVFTMLDGFVEALTNLKRIELKLMDLPLLFFQLFRDNVHNIHVEELILEGTPLTKDDVQCLRSILIKSKLLRYINVGNCRITQYNFAELADGIHKSESIVGYNCNRILGKNLSLDSEKIAYTVSSMIWQNKLQEIEMQQCEFVAQDMEIIAEYMSYKCSYLRKLNVANNKIGPDGALYLLKAIVSSGTLTHLDLNGCGLGNHGGELIAKYISSCYTLQYLNICFNNINSAAINCILLTMKKPIKLHKLQMYGNKYNPKTGNILRRLLGAGVLLQDNIDLTVTFDDTIPGYRVIPWRS